MKRDDIPAAVRKLIADHIMSVEQLEILLLMRARSDDEWDARSLSEEARTSERSAAARLADLAVRGFLSTRDDRGVLRYRYEPSDNSVRHTVDLLETAYAERRYTVIDLIFSKPIDNLKVYADAFLFRKGKDDSDG